MKIAIVGAGLVGVVTARTLVDDGHEVLVFERHPGIASEASYAPGGLLAPELIGLGGEFDRLDRALPPRGLKGAWKRWRQQRPAAQQRRREWLLGLARRSQAQWDAWLGAPPAVEHCEGLLIRLGDRLMASRLESVLSGQPDLGPALERLDGGNWSSLEPDLAVDTPGIGALLAAQARQHNVRQMVHMLREQAEQAGARFVFGVEVRDLRPGKPAALGWRDASGKVHTQQADHVVVCTGAGGPDRWGLHGGLQRESGLSLTLPLRDPNHGPVRGLFDPESGLLLARLGDRVRLSGAWHRPQRHGPSAAQVDALYRHVQRVFPGVSRHDRGQVWTGHVLSSPDGLPRVGPAGGEGLWMHLGHGRLGLALAPAGAAALAVQLAGRDPSLGALLQAA